MLIRMRTTLVLDNRLFHEAKRRAAARGLTLSEIVNEALRFALAKPEPAAPHFQMIIHGEAVPSVHREPAEFSMALEEEDHSSIRH